MRSLAVSVLAAVLITAAAIPKGVAQESLTSPAHVTGFGSGHFSAEERAEAKLRASIQSDTLRSIVTSLTREARIAGTDADVRARDFVVNRLKPLIETSVYPYDVYLPLASRASLEMLAPQRKQYPLEEKLTAEEEKLGVQRSRYPWVNGFSASGNVSAPVAYVSFGLPEDYAALDSLGVSVKGKIALARYGKSYRGIKAKLAEQHGAAALMIYSDPQSDGFDTGDVFPDGPMRPSDGIQRGSVYNGHGDPLTPGVAALPNAPRRKIEQAQVTPHIPVMPISGAIALDILRGLRGHEVPLADWQGGFGFRYHVGDDGGTRMKLAVETDPGIRHIANTVSMIRGTTWPDEWVIVGGHRDSWCEGAEDNASGCASVIAAAEAVAKLPPDLQPKRSVLFVTWDAEEWGLFGSTEWVEQFDSTLKDKAVAYLNQDMTATGASFGASADPVLRPVIYEAARSVQDPMGGSVLAQWSQHVRPFTLPGEEPHPEIGLLGGGSDFSPFYNHLGIPSAEHGFSGRFGQYHSDHDNLSWTLHFGDSTFAYHAASSQLLAIEAMRLANADVLPYDFEELARFLQQNVYPLRLRSIRAFTDTEIAPIVRALDELDSSVALFQANAATFRSLRESKVLSSRSRILSDAYELSRVNRELRGVVQSFAIDSGLWVDPFCRNAIVISDPENGYADLKLPDLTAALRNRDPRHFILGVNELAACARQAAAKLNTLNARLSNL